MSRLAHWPVANALRNSFAPWVTASSVSRSRIHLQAAASSTDSGAVMPGRALPPIGSCWASCGSSRQ